MRDIAPYTEEEAERLGTVLVKLGCPSFGPHVGLNLLRVVEGIDEILKHIADKRTRILLLGLRARFTDVCAIGAAMQGEVFKHAEEIIKG